MYKRHFYASLVLGFIGINAIADNPVCEYWLDYDYANRNSVAVVDSVVSLQLDIEALTPGLHYISLWPKSATQGLGSVMRTAFFTMTSEAKTKLSAIEYWLNNDYSTRLNKAVSSDSIAITVDAAHLSQGVHFFNCRPIDSAGDYGPLMRTMLYISPLPEETVEAKSCETWIDDGFDCRQRMQISPADSLVVIHYDISKMDPGMHFFNYRSVGTVPGPLMRTMFYIGAESEFADKPTYCESWFDYDYDNRQILPLAMTDGTIAISHDISSLAPGMHFFNYRTAGLTFGSVMRTMFYVPQSSQPDVACIKYWIDNQEPIVVKNSNSAITLNIDIEGLEWGEHTFHFCAEDSWGNAGEELTAQFELRDVSEVLADVEWQLLVALCNQLTDQGWENPWDMSCGPEGAYALRGVTVSDSHLTELKLPSEKISGNFPSLALEFPYLSKFDMSDNALFGPLPDASTIAVPLRNLNLSHNQLCGNAGALAANFPTLQKLDLSYNKISLVSPVISSDVIELNLENQDIDYVAQLSLSRPNAIVAALPSIAIYDHKSQSYGQEYNLELSYGDNWNGTIMGDSTQFAIVPEGKEVIYRGTLETVMSAYMGSYSFGVSLQYESGDANLDGLVDIVDLQRSILYIFERNSQLFSYNAADIWCDSIINVQDVAALAHTLASRSIDTSPNRAPSFSHDRALACVKDGILYISSDKDVAAFDIVIDNCLGFELIGDFKKLGFVIKDICAYNQCHIVAYSLSGCVLPAGENAIARVKDGNISYAQLVDEDANRIVNVAETNAIHNVLPQTHVSIQGKSLVFNTESDLVNGKISLYTTDGRLIEIKELGALHPGRYVEELDCIAGIYMVRITADNIQPIILKTTIK